MGVGLVEASLLTAEEDDRQANIDQSVPQVLLVAPQREAAREQEPAHDYERRDGVHDEDSKEVVPYGAL